MPEGLTLPISKPRVYDSSILSTCTRCGVKGLYQYFLNRSAARINFPIQFGQSYHEFRDVVESNYLALELDVAAGVYEDLQLQRFLFETGWNVASKDWEEPETDHRHSYLNESRLLTTCEEAFKNWLEEKALKRLKILQTEQAFELELPSGKLYGGRFDQILEWNGKLWVRDFKTTSRMGKSYGLRFDPNNQFTGYVWAAQSLSGRRVEGVLVEVVYNTKTKGPEFHDFIATRTPDHILRWIETVEFEIEEVERMFEEDRWPFRTTACDDFGGCYFRDACRKSSWFMIQRWLEANTIESVWDFADPDSETGVVD